MHLYIHCAVQIFPDSVENVDAFITETPGDLHAAVSASEVI